ncbi:histidine kinase [candidate division KSB1 bacterium]|nr:histidine kinase [candidate division KSB1 bacterium]
MKTNENKLASTLKSHHFELKHSLVLLVILIFFQLLVSFVHKISLQNFLVRSNEWYQKDYAERIANLTATSLELLLETSLQNRAMERTESRKIIQAFNIILSQQLLQHHIHEVCVLLPEKDGNIVAIEDGQLLFEYLFENRLDSAQPDESHLEAIRMYRENEKQLVEAEEICSLVENKRTFHVFVPFVPRGEYIGAIYMKNEPDFGFITSGIISSYNETSLIFIALVLFGLLAMFYISSYTVRERDDAQKLLFEEREQKLKRDIHSQKEALFVKRIYHTHHKAEKVMGFIKEDLQAISVDNIKEIKYRVIKYANFISRVIYDMKWYEPPIQAIRNVIFKTNLNELIRFIEKNVFLRVSANHEQIRFAENLDDNVPVIHVNEFVAWEVIEPLIQNCVDHSGKKNFDIEIQTKYSPETKSVTIDIADNGFGIIPELLETNEYGRKRIFQENVSTKEDTRRAGYGCYLAYEIATQRCGWSLDAANKDSGGCQFTIVIPST